MNMTADAIVMNKITDIIVPNSNDVSDFLKTIIAKIPIICCMIAVKKMIDNFSGFLEGIGKCLKKLCYTQHTLMDPDNATTECYYINNAFVKRRYMCRNLFFPIYVTNEDDDINISYMSWYAKHRNIVNECKKEGLDAYNKYQLAKNQDIVLYKKLTIKNTELNYIDIKHSTLYESKNYKKLSNIINTHMQVSKITNRFSALGVLIDGCPGLGKTKYVDYAAGIKLVSNIYKVDLTQMLKYPFSTLLNFMYHNIPIVSNTIFMFDEIDKYIDYRIDVEYADEEKSVMNQNKRNETNYTLDKQAFYNKAKTTFLYDMLSIIERDGLEYSVIIIFCSNNFQSIFKDVDMTHHESLYSRFLKVPFNKCDQDEIVDYLLYYQNLFTNTTFSSELTKDAITRELKPNILITHRELDHISLKSNYNIVQIITYLNDYNRVTQEKNINDINTEEKQGKNTLDTNDINTEENSDINTEEKSDINDINAEDESVNINDINTEEKSIDIDDVNSESNVDTLIESEPINKYEQLLYVKENDVEHKLIWDLYYKTTVRIADAPIIINKIKEFLAQVDNEPTKKHKEFICAELFDYLACEGYKVMYIDKFKEAVANKIIELCIADDCLEYLKPSTKQFIYACTGMKL